METRLVATEFGTIEVEAIEFGELETTCALAGDNCNLLAFLRIPGADTVFAGVHIHGKNRIVVAFIEIDDPITGDYLVKGPFKDLATAFNAAAEIQYEHMAEVQLAEQGAAPAARDERDVAEMTDVSIWDQLNDILGHSK